MSSIPIESTMVIFRVLVSDPIIGVLSDIISKAGTAMNMNWGLLVEIILATFQGHAYNVVAATSVEMTSGGTLLATELMTTTAFIALHWIRQEVCNLVLAEISNEYWLPAAMASIACTVIWQKTLDLLNKRYIPKRQRWMVKLPKYWASTCCGTKKVMIQLTAPWRTQNDRRYSFGMSKEEERASDSRYHDELNKVTRQGRTSTSRCWALKNHSWRFLLTTISVLGVALGSAGMAEAAEAPFTTLHGVMVSMTSPTGAYRSLADHSLDSDSYVIAIDNCSSKCITNSMKDFIGAPRKISVSVKGIAGHSEVTYVGTAKWHFEDNLGKLHTFFIPDTYYHRQSPYRLLSPQHWAASVGDHTRLTRCETYKDQVELI
jgi:hypothetical protein